jgi:L-rhamnose-H+ transport protein
MSLLAVNLSGGSELTPTQFAGIWITVVGGACQGLFMLPSRWAKGWRFENTWLIFSLFAYFVFPWSIVFLSVPHVAKVFALTDATTLLLTGLMGIGWGLAAVSFGAGIDAVGLSLGFAIIYGLAAFIGALIPLATTHGLSLFHTSLTVLFLIVMLLGVALCSFAGRWKEQSAPSERKSGLSYRGGVLLCIASGLLGASGNLGFAAGGKLAAAARSLGASSSGSSSIVWAFLCIFMFLFNAGYAVILLYRNASFPRFSDRQAARFSSYGVLMGALWMAGFSLYGTGTQWLGRLGLSLGWGIFMCTVVLVANCCGLLTGEWQRAPRAAKRKLAIGLVVLIVAIVGLSVSSSMGDF